MVLGPMRTLEHLIRESFLAITPSRRLPNALVGELVAKVAVAHATR
jgi:hypothetical protein